MAQPKSQKRKLVVRIYTLAKVPPIYHAGFYYEGQDIWWDSDSKVHKGQFTGHPLIAEITHSKNKNDIDKAISDITYDYEHDFNGYHFLHKNCTDFVNRVLQRLGESLPKQYLWQNGKRDPMVKELSKGGKQIERIFKGGAVWDQNASKGSKGTGTAQGNNLVGYIFTEEGWGNVRWYKYDSWSKMNYDWNKRKCSRIMYNANGDEIKAGGMGLARNTIRNAAKKKFKQWRIYG